MGRVFLALRLRYTGCVQSAILSYALKLSLTRNKAETLACLTALFRRAHADCTTLIEQSEQRRPPSAKGLGEFIGQAYRRAAIDYRRSLKAARKTGRPFKPPTLRAELIDSAEVQAPRTATNFDLWVMVRGTTTTPGKYGGFYVPACKHRALNRTLALPGAKLNESAEVFRRRGAWYARVSVTVPLPQVQEPRGWLGCDIGARAAVTRSDGYRGPDLRPVLNTSRDRRAMHQKQGIDRRSPMSPQRQLLAREARKTVLVALKSGRGVAVESPERLIR